jgi:myo-inositol-1(or 4)-monophosphatase
MRVTCKVLSSAGLPFEHAFWMAFESELEAAVEAARKAADKVRSRAGRLDASAISEKGRNDLVTTSDIESQETIVNLLRPAFPQYEVMAEEDDEHGDIDADQWIIDPIDGTTNFVHGLPPFSVSIALQVSGEVVLGVVLEIDRGELFTSVKGQGTRLNEQRCFVSKVNRAADAMIATGFPTRDYTVPFLDTYLQVLRNMMTGCQSVRRMGSAAADLAYVACGRFDGFFEIGLSPWDSAAGGLLIREAGGSVTDFNLNPDFLHGPQILASNTMIHSALEELVKPLQEEMH